MGSRNGILDMLTLPRLTQYEAPPLPERVQMYLVPTARGWVVSIDGELREYAHKNEAKRSAVLWAHDLVASGHVVSLYIAGLDGRFQEERTYPRSADPRKTPG